jgi:SNF2 family DNA or RNA helicase
MAKKIRWDPDSTDDESDGTDFETWCLLNRGQIRKLKKKIDRHSASTRPINGGPFKAEKLPDLSLREREQVLNGIKLHSDVEGKIETHNAKGLQVLLWELGCFYSLQKHQFLGVRAIAGFANDFPGYLDIDIDTSEDILETLKNPLPRRGSNIDRGLIVADVMGLGKTIQAVAACILRNAVANAKQQPKKPTLIVCPNLAVLVQWYETLVKAGVPKKKIHQFQTGKTTPIRGDIFVLCTIYQLLREVKSCYESVKRGLEGERTVRMSPLFPYTPVALLRDLKTQYRVNKSGGRKKEDNFKDYTVSEYISHLLAQHSCKFAFRTVIVDEAVSINLVHEHRTG